MAEFKSVRLDVGKVLKDKNPKLARFVPRFVVGWVESLIKAKKHNEILALYEHREPYGFIDGALENIGVRYSLYGVENIPADGKILFAANHPLGGVDGMILATAIHNIRPDVKLIVNDILLNIEPIKPIFVGVNKHGAQASELSQKMEELYNSINPIINFPAGLCSRLGKKGTIVDLPWKPSYITKCMKSERVVIPTFVEARNSKFFYRFARFRKWIGIKANLEMVLLPREVFFQQGREVKIYFGEPIVIDNSKTVKDWNNYIREKVYGFKELTIFNS